ncbi:FAD-binding protein [Propionivibrio sp.]|uniref:FAD-binding protein n=1 Tax=Propionivibrio sp. TaxID=2212460 RepID=UPI003BF44914
MALRSWGQLPAKPALDERWWVDRAAALPSIDRSLLAYGNGRSYGDVGLNSGATLLHTRGMDRFIAFDEASGVLSCEAGVLLSEILEVFVPRGWFLPVTPGTRFVTVGGAIANDVHSKNHHGAGTFGCHVRRFELLRSDGSRRICSSGENADWFAATIGGLGLTGLITWVEMELKRISGTGIAVENTRFSGLDEFFALNTIAEARHEYTVAWIDCLASTPRGIFMGGDHVADGDLALAPRKPLSFPLTLPFSLINGLSLRAFNQAYYRRPLAATSVTHYAPFFYPLDGVLHWNRLYGRQGFYQYQLVLPMAAREALVDVLRSISASGQGSFLAVLKTFGERASPGLLSFPMPGVTLALDFPNRGAPTLALFDRLDAIVGAAGGRLYAAKDARMSGEFFRRSYPRLNEFLPFIDPKFSSDFARRVLS